jgi:hypothetical protein
MNYSNKDMQKNKVERYYNIYLFVLYQQINKFEIHKAKIKYGFLYKVASLFYNNKALLKSKLDYYSRQNRQVVFMM